MDNVNYILEQIQKDNTINTYLNNKEAFKKFYFDNMSMGINRFGTKVIEIYQYMLSYDLDDEDISLYKSTIFKDFYDYEQEVTQEPYFKDCKIDDFYIEKFDELIKNYNKLKCLDVENRMLHYDLFIRDITASMIICLNKSFFSLSTENVMKMMNMIRNNDYLKQIIKKDDKMDLMDKDYISQYITRFLFTDEVVNVDELKNDMLINAFKKGEITNKQIIKAIIKLININHIKYVFDDGLSSLADIIEKYFDDEYEQKNMFKIIYDKLVEKKEYQDLGYFIIHDERCKLYIDQESINNILYLMFSNYPIDMDETEVRYMLEYKCQNNQFNILDILNLKENLKYNNWNENTKQLLEKILSKSPNIDYNIEQAFSILDSVFHNQKISEIQLFGAIKRIIKEYLHDDDINIYLVLNSTFNGCACKDENVIKIDVKSIQKMIQCLDLEQNPDAIGVLDIGFHEARHIEQYKNMEQETISKDFYKMYKENIVVNILSGYYENNYYGISYEKDARIEGKKLLINMLKNRFPYMKNCINFYEKKLNEELSQDNERKKFFELSDDITVDEILRKIILINPSILKNNQHLKLEYPKIDQDNKIVEDEKGKLK